MLAQSHEHTLIILSKIFLAGLHDLLSSAAKRSWAQVGVWPDESSFSGDFIMSRCSDKSYLVQGLSKLAWRHLWMTPYLFSKAPNEVSAVRAEGGLTQKRRHEFVRVDLKKTQKILSRARQKGCPD